MQAAVLEHFNGLNLARKIVIIDSFFVSIAAILFSVLLVTHHLPYAPLSNSSLPKPRPAFSVAKPEQVSGTPVYVSIPSLNINVPVIKGYELANGTWTLTINSAQFATITKPSNNYEGNTFIYAHYRAGLFINLHLIQPGALAYVTTDNGYKFTYKYEMTYALKPTNTQIFAYSGAPILTLQTCSGAQFQNRQMFQFGYVSYQKLG